MEMAAGCAHAHNDAFEASLSVHQELTRNGRSRAAQTAISERVRRVQEEQAQLEQLHKQVKSMETVQVHGIEQLRTEIVKVTATLGTWTQKLRDAEQRLAQSTAQLERCQETKRILSERLFEMLLESEEAKHERLQSVEASLDDIELTGPEESGAVDEEPVAVPQ